MNTFVSPGSHSAAPLTGRKVLAMFVVFFGTVAAVNAVLFIAATRTWSGVDVVSPYKAGQLYNSELRNAREQDARGWKIDAAVMHLPAAVAAVTVTLSDRGGQPLRGKTLQARLERPTDKRLDVGVDLLEVSAGTYAARIEPVVRGQWDLVVEVVGDSEIEFRRRHRIVLN